MTTSPLPSHDPSEVLGPQRYFLEMLGALEDEIRAAPKPPCEPITLCAGRLMHDHRDGEAYEFAIPCHLKSLPRDSHASGTADGMLVRGKLKSSGSRRMRFETHAELGPRIEELTVTLDTTFLLTSLHQRLKELGAAGPGAYPFVHGRLETRCGSMLYWEPTGCLVRRVYESQT